MKIYIRKGRHKCIKDVISTRYKCIILKADYDILTKLKREKIDLAFNLCNGIRGRTRLAQIPALLEFAGIPYTSSSILGHTLAINKHYACKIFKEAGLPTPRFASIYNLEELEQIQVTSFPVLVKPCDEGSGRGIHQDSLVYDMDSLVAKVRKGLKTYNPPILVTEYIKGREFTVGILGNGDSLEALPILEICFEGLPKNLAKFYSFEVKTRYEDHTVFKCPAPLNEKLRNEIIRTAKRAYKALNMRDYARVDIRLKGNTPYILEINSLPGLQKGYSDITKMVNACSLKYDGLIFKIIHNAIKRYNLTGIETKVG